MIMDDEMPEMKGSQACKEIKTDSENPNFHTPIFTFSATYADSLSKPFEHSVHRIDKKTSAKTLSEDKVYNNMIQDIVKKKLVPEQLPAAAPLVTGDVSSSETAHGSDMEKEIVNQKHPELRRDKKPNLIPALAGIRKWN